jgi:hypothetical protein
VASIFLSIAFLMPVGFPIDKKTFDMDHHIFFWAIKAAFSSSRPRRPRSILKRDKTKKTRGGAFDKEVCTALAMYVAAPLRGATDPPDKPHMPQQLRRAASAAKTWASEGRLK